MTEKRYMHLMDSKPAFFDSNNNYMFFADRIIFEKLPKYLYQIKKEQELAKKSDGESHFKPSLEYSYMIVRIK